MTHLALMTHFALVVHLAARGHLLEREHLVYRASAYVLCSRIGTWMCKLESKGSEILQKERAQKSAGDQGSTTVGLTFAAKTAFPSTLRRRKHDAHTFLRSVNGLV